LAIYQPNVSPSDGPYDVNDVRDPRPFIDFGSLRVIPRSDIHLKAEIEEHDGNVVAITIDYKGSSLQLQAFAAPKSAGLWQEVRDQLRTNFESQGSPVEERLGSFGPELVASIVDTGLGIKFAGRKIARFVGVDGPRWFLRGIITGPGATEPVSAFDMDEIFRGVIVNRGDEPIPPRDLLPLVMPESALLNRDFLG
jgi:hypothetical protein